MNVIKLEGPINTTENCKEQLNKYVATKNWKRLYKLGDLRCFTNDAGEFVTVAEGSIDDDIENCAFIGINVYDEIKAIHGISKYYYTHDYGEMFYNPYTKELHIVGGDGGYGYSKTPIKEDDDSFFENYDHDKDFIEFNAHSETSFITSIVWADEYYPEDLGYMRIGSINLIDG